MQTQTPRSSAAETQKPWRTVLIVVLVLILAGVGIWAVVAFMPSDDLDVATERVDEWLDGWNASDPDAIVAVFTEDAVYSNPDATFTGKNEIYDHAVEYQDAVANGIRTDDGTETAIGLFTFPITFDSAGGTYDGEIESGTFFDAATVKTEFRLPALAVIRLAASF